MLLIFFTEIDFCTFLTKCVIYFNSFVHIIKLIVSNVLHSSSLLHGTVKGHAMRRVVQVVDTVTYVLWLIPQYIIPFVASHNLGREFCRLHRT